MKKAKLKSQRKIKSAFLRSLMFFFFAGLCSGVYAQDIVTGKVIDENSDGIIGASVLVKGTSKGTITDVDGNFSINASPDDVLVISYVGYKTNEVNINGRTAVNLQMVVDTDVLDEVVVVGYGTQRRVNLTGAVSTVGEQTFLDKGTVTNPLAVLQGQVPGMSVYRGSTAPGREDWKFRIRGEASTNQTDALVLIDGVPGGIGDINPDDIENISILKDASAAIYGSRAAGGVVLVTTKRGQNAKPQVTYKGNVSVKVPSSKYEWMNMQQWATYVEELAYNDDYSMANSGKYAQMGAFPYNMLYAMKTMDPRYIGTIQSYTDMGGTAAGINDIGFFDYDPYDATFETAYSQSQSLSLSGGNENMKYNVSLGYMYDGSPLAYNITDNSKRYNARANNDFRINKWVDVKTQLSFDRRNSVYPYNRPSGVNGNPPGSPTFTKDGGPYGWASNYNDAARAKFGGSVYKQTENFNFNIQPQIHILKGLDLNLLGAYYAKNFFNKEYENEITWCDYEGNEYSFSSPTANKFNREARSVKGQNYQAYFNYLTDFSTEKTHNFSAMAGTSYEREDSESFNTEMKNFPEALLHSFSEYDADVSTLTATDDKYTTALASYYGRLNYDYKGKYLGEFIARYDGSSMFVRGKKWHAFFGGSLGWRLSEEDFVKQLNIFDNLKIRASYGETGNQSGLGRYDFVALINSNVSSGNSHSFPIFGSDATAGSTPTQTYTQRNTVALDRTWEIVKTTNVGLDFAILNNRLSGTFEVFQRKNENMLVSVTYPAVYGATAPQTNHGELKVNGWELSLAWHDRIGKDFTYSIGFNIGDAKNKLISMPNATVASRNAVTSAMEGYSLNSYWGMRYEKIISSEEELTEYITKLNAGPAAGRLPEITQLKVGDAKYKDTNGDGVVDYDDMEYLGDATLRYNYGINLNFGYKNFDLGLIFQGIGKANIIRDLNALSTPGYSWYQIQGAQYYDITWGTMGNDPNYLGEAGAFDYVGTTVYPTASDYRRPYTDPYNAYPRWSLETKNYNTIYSDAFWRLQNMAYCRLKNITLGYTLPKSISKKLNIEHFRVYFTGTDLFTFSRNDDGTDPENMNRGLFDGTNGSASYPFSRTFSFGIDLTF